MHNWALWRYSRLLQFCTETSAARHLDYVVTKEIQQQP